MEEASLKANKRGRGRPVGSTRYKDLDSRIIARAGDALLANTDLTTRAAIARAVKRETGKDDANALRRVQMKMDRTAAVAAASERREARRRRQDEQAAKVLWAVLDFVAGGPTFQQFVAQPKVQEVARKVMTFCIAANKVARHIDAQLPPIVQAATPIITELQQARARAVIDVPRLR